MQKIYQLVLVFVLFMVGAVVASTIGILSTSVVHSATISDSDAELVVPNYAVTVDGVNNAGMAALVYSADRLSNTVAFSGIQNQGQLACVQSPYNTHSAIGCSLAEVQIALGNASPGDIVEVPAGACTWDSPLVITKGVTLMGAGIGKTIITGNFYDDWNGVISYKPDTEAVAEDQPARITGFTLDANNLGLGICVTNESATPIKNVRIDHNRIINVYGRGVYIRGSIYGVADNNQLETFGHGMDGEGYGGGRMQWENLPREYGNRNNFYFEDNTLISNGTGVFHAGGQGGRWVARYNSYSGNTANLSPVFDAHGNQYAGGINGIYGTMITEWYGNEIDLGNYGAGTYFDQRGGWALFFFNNITSTNSTTQLWVREEFDDATFPYTNTFAMKVSNSYYWNNRRNNSTLLTTKIGSDLFQREPDIPNDPPALMEDREFWNQKIPFDGTSGIGCGTLTGRPATCTPGVGYWATEQPCADLTGMVGPNPAMPISGTLYKCVATNTWGEPYTPYAYPHPLRISGPLADCTELELYGRPNNGSILLDWTVNVTLPVTTTWDIDYYTTTTTAPFTVTGLISTTRSFTLTEHAQNYQWYTVTLYAMLDETQWLSDTVRVMPTNRFVYLPLVLK